MRREREQQIAALRPGDHLCLIYDNLAEQMAAVAAFMRDGLAAGERCVYIADDRTFDEVAGGLAAVGIDVARERERGALLLLTKRDTYLRSGEFHPAAMIALLRQTIEDALAAGFTGLRATGEMTWALGTEVGCDRLIEYEALLNNFFPGRQILAICQYNRRRFPPTIIRDVLRTHPIVIVGDQVCPSLYFEPPDQVLGQTSEADRVDWMLTQLRRARTLEEEIQALNVSLERRVVERTAELDATVREREQQMAERQRAEQQLRLQVAALEAAANAIVMTDQRGAIQWVNPAFTRLTGYSAAEAIGHNPRILKSGQMDRAFYQGLWDTIHAGRVWHGDIVNRRKDGSLYVEEMTITPVRDTTGGIVNYIAIKQDVTDRRRAEEERTRLLAMEQAARTEAEAATARLQEVNQQLIAANKELEGFSYSVSHDLRAPLRAIDGFSRILLEEHAPELVPDAQRYLHLVRNNAQQMGRLIDDLLAFSRLSRQPLNKQTVELSDLVRQVLEDLRAEREGRRVEVRVGDLPPCQADPALLRQVLMNLLANALKFTRKRELAEMEVGSREVRGERVYFVKDNGVGFDMRYADKLFGVFQRLHRAEEYEGTGVGLAIVQRIIHRHGGRVWAEAAVNEGATFLFQI
ncbi:MAG: MEDS domain-containing protein [Chloroflexi bacterium]|nr:MEDS domain-containing protein [Chloroflexota bacterium]